MFFMVTFPRIYCNNLVSLRRLIVTNYYSVHVKYIIILVVKYNIWISLLRLPEQVD